MNCIQLNKKTFPPYYSIILKSVKEGQTKTSTVLEYFTDFRIPAIRTIFQKWNAYLYRLCIRVHQRTKHLWKSQRVSITPIEDNSILPRSSQLQQDIRSRGYRVKGFSSRKARLDASAVNGVIKRIPAEGAWRAGAYRALQKVQRDRRRFYRSHGNLLEEVLLRCAGVSVCTIANKFQQLWAARPLSFSTATMHHPFLVLFIRASVSLYLPIWSTIESVPRNIQPNVSSYIPNIRYGTAFPFRSAAYLCHFVS